MSNVKTRPRYSLIEGSIMLDREAVGEFSDEELEEMEIPDEFLI